MNVAIYIGIFMAGFLTLLLSVKKTRESHDFILITWLLLSAGNLIFFYHDFNNPGTQNLTLELLGGLLPFLTAPLLYFYVCALVVPRKFRLVRYLYHFLPFILMYSAMLYHAEEYHLVVDKGFIQMRGPLPFYLGSYGLILAFFSFLYPMLSLFLLFRHRNRIKSQFSYIEKINMNWLRYWIILSMLGFWFSFVIIWAGSFQWIDFLTSFQGVAGAVVLNISVIGFYGVKQTTIFTNLQPPIPVESNVPQPERYASSKLADDKAQEMVAKVKRYMEQEKPYLNSQLSLESLASALLMTKHDLSQVINDQFHTNFFGFVNDYRVAAFKESLQDKKYEHYTLLGIALETGFSSKSSFNSIFKKTAGITPSEYKKSLSRTD
ncbi:MAG: helix-turn-helix transcriptional regulator [Roseivirga sp.]|nr:helix-turn-helix transcriptional regulator [Roseivirga sp.]